jgi:hypothetical protein
MFSAIRLVLLRHKRRGRDRPVFGTAQHGHHGRPVASATINFLRIVAIESNSY